MDTDGFPVIDISGGVDLLGEQAEKIVQACKVWGFMILTGHGISQKTVDRMFELHQGFCEQPVEAKRECLIDERQIGYDVKRSKIGVHECMVFGGKKGEVLEGKNLSTWWDTERRAEVEEFKSAAHHLGQRLLRVFAVHFGLAADYFSSAHNDEKGPGSVLRMLHYPKLETLPDKNFPRLYAHTDWGSLTFVWPRSGGLEVETPSGTWLEVPLVQQGVIVNVGDAMSLWSGRSLKSTLHKISFDKLPVGDDRWSMAYFVNANQDAPLSVLRREINGTLSHDKDAIALTMGEYAWARQYMSQKEDAKNNWVSTSTADIESAKRIARAVEALGVANGSGLINFSAVKA
ncbi:hypothetical protein NKR23_g6630 [Pleurostoma richardsiae]|uniref:Fe2OG dioxygenase domain-containing protein n=1 Tax=Pleurostoma richardsiae TaxID=41990 RepID=A0AA38VHP8_9PEZI|nr:hypothetical protein NKR23_g6630 [Pleurostoma richardsiae]